MKPMHMETIHTAKATLPTVPAMPPIENRTSAGTPLATQNAPFQSIVRCRLACAPSVIAVIEHSLVQMVLVWLSVPERRPTATRPRSLQKKKPRNGTGLRGPNLRQRLEQKG